MELVFAYLAGVFARINPCALRSTLVALKGRKGIARITAGTSKGGLKALSGAALAAAG